MPNTSPANIAITGASSGLGAALAKEFSGPGRQLFLCARRSDLMTEVANACRKRGATTETSSIDVRSRNEFTDWLTEIDARHAIDLLIVNAGVFGGHGPDGHLEENEEIADIIGTNLTGAILAATTMANKMRSRRRGHIVLISSLASFYPQADAPTYSASKAGLTAYGEALREFLQSDGVTVSIVHPGNIETAQTDVQQGRKPMLISADRAAAHIRRGVEKGKSNINFPYLLYVLVWMNRILPWKLRAQINKSFRFFVKNKE